MAVVESCGGELTGRPRGHASHARGQVIMRHGGVGGGGHAACLHGQCAWTNGMRMVDVV